MSVVLNSSRELSVLFRLVCVLLSGRFFLGDTISISIASMSCELRLFRVVLFSLGECFGEGG